MSAIVYIILPVYNWENYLLQQLMSIYFQDYKNWHLIIINDGSTDSTESVINKFIWNYNLGKKVTVINQENQWLNKSIENWLMEAKKIIKSSWCSDAYITYCDADDLMMTNRLSYQVDFMGNHKECDLSYHDLILIDENNTIIDMSYLKMLNKSFFSNIKCDRLYEFCWANHIPSTTIMFKSDKIDLLLPFPNSFPFQDRRTALVFSWNNLNIENIWKSLWYYRRYKNQMSDTSWKKVNISKKFNDFSKSLNNLKNNLIDKKRINEIEEYIKYYKDKSKWIEMNTSKIKQKFLVIFYHPKILIYRLLSYL